MPQPADPAPIGSGPHDPDPPPDPKAVLDAILAGAEPDGTGALKTTKGLRWLHIGRAGWELRDWRDAAHGCEITRPTFDALTRAATSKAPLAALGQRLGLMPRDVHGRLVAELTIVGPVSIGGPIDPDIVDPSRGA